MSLPPGYLNAWANWRSGPPAADPRGPHHHATEPDDDFLALCDIAERVGLHAELDVSASTFGEEPYEYRNVVAILVRSGDAVLNTRLGVTIRAGVGEGIPAMARRARRELEAKL